MDAASASACGCAKGGNGGFGNARFKGPINPGFRAGPIRPGRARKKAVWLRLKLISPTSALLGLPNAGKSTFLAATSAARPKIADYPFTTLTPGLGVVDLSPTERFVMADIPGLIEGASEGAGLGTRFLGHVERTAVLIHLVDGTQEDVAGSWRTVREELAAYGEGLADKAEILALNKVDALDPETRERCLPRPWPSRRRPARPDAGVRRLRRGRRRPAARRPGPGARRPRRGRGARRGRPAGSPEAWRP